MNHRLFLEDTYLFELTTKIRSAGHDTQGHYVIPVQTLFHPQGGGQPDDEGSFISEGRKYEVNKLVGDKEKGEIKHYYNAPEDAPLLKEDQTIDMVIDREKRLHFAAYHTAGHLIADIIEATYPSLAGIKGNHFPDKGAVIFVIKEKIGQPVDKADYTSYDLEEMKTKVTEEMDKLRTANAPIKIDNSGPKRTMQIADMKEIPCGGTHLRHLGELPNCFIKKIALKKREGLKVSYTF
ncbi:MAG: hypothetical protein AAF335_01945 [Bacteroidota bacterium]